MANTETKELDEWLVEKIAGSRSLVGLKWLGLMIAEDKAANQEYTTRLGYMALVRATYETRRNELRAG